MLNNAMVMVKKEAEEIKVPVSKFLKDFQSYTAGKSNKLPEILAYNYSNNTFKYIIPRKYDSIPTISKLLTLDIEGITSRVVSSTSRILIRNNGVVTTIPVDALKTTRTAFIGVVVDKKVEFKRFLGLKDVEAKDIKPEPKKRGRKKKEATISTNPVIPLTNPPPVPALTEREPEAKVEKSNYRFESGDGSLFVVDDLIMK